MKAPQLKVRKQGRAFPINKLGDVLLVQYEDSDPGNPTISLRNYWVPPGGGLEANETFEQAALRELYEETGIVASRVGRQLCVVEKPLQFRDELMMMHAEYYLVPLPCERQALTILDKDEGILDVRWWSFEEVRASSDIFFPENFLAVFGNALAILGLAP